jgi:hypothetical protein
MWSQGNSTTKESIKGREGTQMELSPFKMSSPINNIESTQNPIEPTHNQNQTQTQIPN